MDVIGFLFLSIGSITVQLHDNLGSKRARANSESRFGSQNGVYCRRTAFCCMFLLWAKILNAKDIHKEMLLVHIRKCLSPKVVHNLVTKVSLMTKSSKRSCGSR
jgi:hypothetical protein